MKLALAALLLALPMAACSANKPQELVCFKPNPNRVTVHYKNADRITYNHTSQMWVIVYWDTKDFAGGEVHYKQDLHESCVIRGQEEVPDES